MNRADNESTDDQLVREEQLLRSMRPTRRRPEPLWHQVEAAIRAGIEQGVFATGARLPGEDRLTELLGVSRITVRHALANLDVQGVVRRQHGRGTFVRSPRLVTGERGLTSLSQELAALGLDARTEILDVGVVEGSALVTDGLELPESADVLRVRRLRYGGGEPIGIQTAHLRPDRVLGLDADAIEGRSLYDVLAERYGIEPLEADETYRVGSASPDEARLLDVADAAPVFVIVRVTSDELGPFEVTMSTMRSDRYEIRSTLRSR